MEKERRKRIIRIVLLSALGVGALVFMAFLDSVFGPLLFALLLAYILNPVVNWIQRFHVGRSAAIALLFLIFYGAVVGFILLTVPALAKQVANLHEAVVGDRSYVSLEEVPESRKAEAIRLPERDSRGFLYYVDTNGNGEYDPGYLFLAADWLIRRMEYLRREHEAEFNRSVEALRSRFLTAGSGAVKSALTSFTNAVFTFFGFATLFVLVPIYLYYFLMGLSKMRDRVMDLLPGRHRPRILVVLTAIDDSVSAFFRGRLIIMAIKGAVVGVALAILGVPFSLIIGILTGVGSLIPVVGFLLGVVPGTAIAFLDSGSVGLAAVVIGIFLVMEFFENYVLTPWILKDRVGLHPVTLIVSVFVGGALFGFVGMLLAVPMAAVAKILFLEFVLPEIQLLAAEKPEILDTEP